MNMKTLTTAAIVVLMTSGASYATNLTSLGVNASGNTVWRITNTSDAPREVELRRHGGGSPTEYIINPGQQLVVEGGQPGTYIAEFDNGPRKTKASGPQTYTPPSNTGPQGADGRDGVDGQDGADGVDGRDGVDGVDGRDGRDGVDGRDGQDGRSVDYSQYLSDMATVAGIGGLEMRTPYEGGFVWSMGIAGIENDFGGALAMSAGIGYGITENMSIYGKISVGEHSTVASVGIEGRF